MTKYQIKLVLNKPMTADERLDAYSKIVIENGLNRKGYLFYPPETPDGKSGMINVKVSSITGIDGDVEEDMKSAFGSHGEFSIETASAEKL